MFRAQLKSTLLFGQIWVCGSSTYYGLFPNLIPACCHDNSIYTSIKNKGAFTTCETHTKNKNHQYPEVSLNLRHSEKGHSINVPMQGLFMLNQNQLDLTTALAFFLSSRSHFSLLSFPPLPFSAVLILMQMQFWGCSRWNTFWYYGSLKWNGIQQNTKEILQLLEHSFTYK